MALLATGDEITSGQTLNTNTHWLAWELGKLGFEVTHHLSVPDDEAQIKEALFFLENKANFIIMIGGLGPTRDDLTRHAVAKYFGLSLQKNESEWKVIIEKLKAKNVTPRAGHESQAMFPQGAEILDNSAGTACGFQVSKNAINIICLPGPPVELKAIFDEVLRPKFREKNFQSSILKTWQFINVPESELAARVEKLYENWPYKIGYRASPPLVEFKVWFQSEQLKEYSALDKKLTELMGEQLHSRNQKDYVKEFFDQEDAKILIHDEVTEGLFYQRLQKSLSQEKQKLLVYQTAPVIENSSLPKVHLHIADEQLHVGYKENVFKFKLPKKNITSSVKKYCIEVAFKKLLLS